jgi:hypothetical protein
MVQFIDLVDALQNVELNNSPDNIGGGLPQANTQLVLHTKLSMTVLHYSHAARQSGRHGLLATARFTSG